VTTYIALSPKRRTEHTTWEGARGTLVDDARDLARAKKDTATKAMFADIADELARRDDDCLRRYDAWGNPITFRIVSQEQLPV
jgi:hypothetical protein